MVGKIWEDKMEYENFTSPKKQTCSCNNLFLTQYYNRKEEKICTSAIPHISKEPHECGKLSGVQIFLLQVTVEKWPQDHYFSQKVLLVGTPNVISNTTRQYLSNILMWDTQINVMKELIDHWLD